MKIKPVLTKYIPERIDMEDGILYISREFKTAIHMCPCGCGEEINTNIDDKTGWKIVVDGDNVDVSPSIGNYRIPCKTHYFIRSSEIVWC